MKNLLLGFTVLVLLVSCTSSTKLTTVHSTKNLAYCEIFVSSFYDSDANGSGDLNGITEKLDYLYSTLGVGGIWLMPIMPSPSYHKYDVVDYYNIDSSYGSMADFENLVSKAAELKMEIIIDLVVNHTSIQNPWFISARDHLFAGTCDQPESYCDYYNFSTVPKAGYRVLGNGFYYESLFSADMPDLNLDTPSVRDEISKIVKFWLDKGVKGFRLDAVTSYYNGNTTKNVEFLRWLKQTVKTVSPNAYIVGEAWTDSVTISDYYKSGIDSFFDFPSAKEDGQIVNNIRYQTGQSFASFTATNLARIKTASPESINAIFLSNHDNARSGAYFSGQIEKQKLMASVYMLMPGRSFIYYGEEIGLKGSGVDPNKRLPMIWDIKNNTGMTTAPIGANYVQKLDLGVKQQFSDKNSLLNHYRRIISIKNNYDLITMSDSTLIKLGNPEIYVMRHKNSTEELIVLHNFSDKIIDIDYDFSAYKILEKINNSDTSSKTKLSNGVITIYPYTSLVLGLK